MINVHHLINLFHAPQFFWDVAKQVLLRHPQTPVCGGVFGKCTLPQFAKFGSNYFTNFDVKHESPDFENSR